MELLGPRPMCWDPAWSQHQPCPRWEPLPCVCQPRQCSESQRVRIHAYTQLHGKRPRGALSGHPCSAPPGWWWFSQRGSSTCHVQGPGPRAGTDDMRQGPLPAGLGRDPDLCCLGPPHCVPRGETQSRCDWPGFVARKCKAKIQPMSYLAGEGAGQRGGPCRQAPA